MKKYFFLFFFLLSCTFLQAENSFIEAEKLLMNNKRTEAASLFKESIIGEQSNNPKAYFYLAYIYEIEKDYKTAISYLQKGLSKTSGEDYKFYFNLGNNYFKDNDYENALLMFTKSLELENEFADPYLNRANCHVKRQEYLIAINDYETFLRLRPNSPKSEKIRRVIQKLKSLIAEKIEKEKADKARREAEEARKRELLNSVLDSLNDAGENSTNLSAKSETIKDVEIDVDIED